MFLAAFFRCTKLLETLKKIILALPINDVMNEELFVNLENIRAKFKQVFAAVLLIISVFDLFLTSFCVFFSVSFLFTRVYMMLHTK